MRGRETMGGRGKGEGRKRRRRGEKERDGLRREGRWHGCGGTRKPLLRTVFLLFA